MRTASKLILALPTVGVALDAGLWHAPAYVAALVLALCLLILARRVWDWCRTRPDSVLTAALVGFPFFLLLAVAGLTK